MWCILCSAKRLYWNGTTKRREMKLRFAHQKKISRMAFFARRGDFKISKMVALSLWVSAAVKCLCKHNYVEWCAISHSPSFASHYESYLRRGPRRCACRGISCWSLLSFAASAPFCLFCRWRRTILIAKQCSISAESLEDADNGETSLWISKSNMNF